MKAATLTTIVVLVVSLLVIGMAPAIQAADVTYVTGTEVWDPFGLMGPPVGTLVTTGVVTCPGHEPTGDLFAPCPEGSRLNRRGMKLVARVESSDPRARGWLTIEANNNLDPQRTGFQWGTFRLDLDDDPGVWEGSWSGTHTVEGDHWISVLHVVGHGSGGSVDGMQLILKEIQTMRTPIAYTATLEARLLDPDAN